MHEQTQSFGCWLRRRRKALDLTQQALAQQVFCSGFTIRKIEADERRPSRHLAERLAKALAVPDEQRRSFMAAARTLQASARLPASASINAPAAAHEQPAVSRHAGETLPLVGRDAEMQQLAGRLDQLAKGQGTTVLIDGEPGIGKSRLLRELTRLAQQRGVPTLAATCYEIERATPYQPVIQLIAQALERIADAALAVLNPVSLAELAALLPELQTRVPALPQLSNDFPQARQARLPGAVQQLLEASFGATPGVLLVDDIQWADEASVLVLQHLARRSTPMLVVYGCRDDELASDEHLSRRTNSLRRDAQAMHLPLRRLAVQDTERLVAACGDSRLDALAERLHRETEGNPFFLVSMLQSLRASELGLPASTGDTPALLPEALRDAVRVRLAHVPKPFRTTLEFAAVLGRHFDFDTLAAVSGESEDLLLDAVDALVKRHLWVEEGDDGHYDFSHAKIREVLYGDLGGARRRARHLAVAEALERRADAGESAARLAEHYERAQVWPKALQHLLRAGEAASALFAMREALHWFDRAVVLCESHAPAQAQALGVYASRGAARAQAGFGQGAVADMQRVVDAARTAGEPRRLRDALVQLGMAYRRADAYEEATACLSEALAQSRALHDQHHAADTLYHLGTVAWSTGRNRQAIEFHQQAVDIVERSAARDLVAVQAWHGRGEAYFANAEPAAAIDCYTRSLTLARAIGDKSYESENLMMIGHACTGSKGLAQYLRAMANFDAALAIARKADLQWHLGPTLLGADHVRACTGSCGVAFAGMTNTLHWLEGLGQTRYQLIAHDLLCQLLLDIGRNDLALEQAERALALGRDSGIMFWRTNLRAQAAIAGARLGQTQDDTPLREALDETLRNSERYMTLRCLEALAEIALQRGDTGGCLAHADSLLGLALVNGLREFEASARRWRGVALLAQQARESAHAELLRAAALADDIGRVRTQLDCHVALARLHRALHDEAAAQREMAKARAGARTIADSLAAAGPTPALEPALR